MTFSAHASDPREQPGAPPALVLLAAGPAAAVAGLQSQGAPLLATALGLPLLASLDPLDPDGALAALAAGPPGLAPLPHDPGLPLANGRHWASALGAWRQPAVLLLAEEQLHTGLPAAFTALLAQWQAPCLGLVQWGGSWEPQQRRLEGLPCLCALATGPQGETGPHEEAGAALRSASAARWAALERQRQA